MTHCVALPILCPITFFGLLNNFITERILLARYYKQPPLYDNRLNKRALDILKTAPLFSLAMGYWYLGNRQNFFNDYKTVTHAFGEVKNSGHKLFADFGDGPNHTMPILIVFPMVIFFQFVVKVVIQLIKFFGGF